MFVKKAVANGTALEDATGNKNSLAIVFASFHLKNKGCKIKTIIITYMVGVGLALVASPWLVLSWVCNIINT